MSNEAVAEDLGISVEKAEELAKLQPEEGMSGISREVYYIAKLILMRQPYVDQTGQNKDLHDSISKILGVENPKCISEQPQIGF